MPLSSFATFVQTIEPSERLQFQQMNAIIIEGVVSSESNMGEAIKSLEQSTRLAPFDNLTWDYAGEARQFKKPVQRFNDNLFGFNCNNISSTSSPI